MYLVKISDKNNKEIKSFMLQDIDFISKAGCQELQNQIKEHQKGIPEDLYPLMTSIKSTDPVPRIYFSREWNKDRQIHTTNLCIESPSSSNPMEIYDYILSKDSSCKVNVIVVEEKSNYRDNSLIYNFNPDEVI